jgi:hypothetical protein
MKYTLLFYVVALCSCTVKPDKEPVINADRLEDSATNYVESQLRNDSSSQTSLNLTASEADTARAIFTRCIEDIGAELRSVSVYKMSASFSGYESSSDATYYFDSLFNLTYAEIAWSMEGTSGSYTYYFSNGNLTAGLEVHYYNAYDEYIFICRANEAFGYKSNNSEANTEGSFITEAEFNSKVTDASSEFNRLIGRISEYASSGIKEEGITRIQIENTVTTVKTTWRLRLLKLIIRYFLNFSSRLFRLHVCFPAFNFRVPAKGIIQQNRFPLVAHERIII